MTLTDDFMEDRDRRERTGQDECVLCAYKSVEQITRIVGQIFEEGRRVLLTRLSADQYSKLPKETRAVIAYDTLSCTAVVGEPIKLNRELLVAIVSGGTSDVSVVAEAAKTLEYYGYVASIFQDIGVAGLWRVVDAAPALQNFPIVIAVAGMDAALPTVLAGLVPSAVIAVPTSVGYGVAAGGTTALNSLLSSCVPGITVVNIDNGFGAASAAVRMLNAIRTS